MSVLTFSRSEFARRRLALHLHNSSYIVEQFEECIQPDNGICMTNKPISELRCIKKKSHDFMKDDEKHFPNLLHQ